VLVCAQCVVKRSADTSTGGLEALFLFVKLWDITDALKTFRHLAERCFSKAVTTAFSSLGQLRSYVRCLFQDSMYKADALEEILKDCFGNHLRMFDYPDTGTSRCKVAVTATTTATTSTRLFTNYNGCSLRKPECGKIMLPESRSGL